MIHSLYLKIDTISLTQDSQITEKEIAIATLLKYGEWGIRTPAPVTRPNDLANRPLQPLE